MTISAILLPVVTYEITGNQMLNKSAATLIQLLFRNKTQRMGRILITIIAE